MMAYLKLFVIQTTLILETLLIFFRSNQCFFLMFIIIYYIIVDVCIISCYGNFHIFNKVEYFFYIYNLLFNFLSRLKKNLLAQFFNKKMFVWTRMLIQFLVHYSFSLLHFNAFIIQFTSHWLHCIYYFGYYVENRQEQCFI